MTTPRVLFSLLTILIITAFVLGLSPTRSSAKQGPLTTAEWQADLTYLARELPKRHVAPFVAISETSFRAQVKRIEELLPSLSAAQVQVEFGRLVAALGDGHTELWLPTQGRGFSRYPFQLYDFDGDLRVLATTEEARPALGARLVAIEGRPVDEARVLLRPLIGADNEMEILLSLPRYLEMAEVLHAVGLVQKPDEARFRFERDGETFELDLTSQREIAADAWVDELGDDPPPLYRQRPQDYYWFSYLEDSRTMFVKYNRCANQKGQRLSRFAKDLFRALDERPVERLVIDLRHNRGGNYHRSDPLIEGLRKRADINQEGRLFVITGRVTFSAAAVTAIRLQRETEATIVGEPSRSRPNGSDNYEWFLLPTSGLRVNYSDRFKDHAPELGDADWLPVDLPVGNSYEDFVQGRDRVLETILAQPAPGRAAG